MTTLTTTDRAVKPGRHLFTLEATIDNQGYAVFPVREIEDPAIAKAFTFRKLGLGHGDAVYTIARHTDGRVTCECPDFVVRHEDHGTLCKHAQCCVRMGLLDAPTPTPAPSAPSAPRLRPRDEFDPPGSPALMPVVPPARVEHGPAPSPEPSDADRLRAAGEVVVPARRPDVRTVGGMTIDLDIWRNGPRPQADPCCSPAEADPCTACLKAPAPEPAAWGYGMPAWSLGPDDIEDAPPDAPTPPASRAPP